MSESDNEPLSPEQLKHVWHSLTPNQKRAIRQVHDEAVENAAKELAEASSKFSILYKINAVFRELDR